MSDINIKCVFCGETTLQKTIKDIGTFMTQLTRIIRI